MCVDKPAYKKLLYNPDNLRIRKRTRWTDIHFENMWFSLIYIHMLNEGYQTVKKLFCLMLY